MNETHDGVVHEQLDADELNRLWQHGMHEERLFHDRLNYFSAVQVGLIGSFGILYNKEPALGVLIPLATVGLAFSLLWLRVQVRHWRYCLHVNKRMTAMVSDYAQTIASFASAPCRTDGLSIARPLAYAVPLLFAAIWVALFVWLIGRAA
jgi:hypothetical protein